MQKSRNIQKKKCNNSRVTHTLTNEEQTSINSILTNFFTYFKAKHL